VSQSDVKAKYDRDGFVVVRQFLDPDELRKLSEQLDRYIRDVVPGLSDAHAFYADKTNRQTLKQLQHMAVDDFFRQYMQHPSWNALAKELCGEEVNAAEPEWFNKPRGTRQVTPPHQDNYYFCLVPPNVATIWLALDVVNEENGCLRYVRGSHRRGVRPHSRSNVLGFSQSVSDYGELDRSEEVPIPLEPGDVVAHHGDTIHRADANQSSTRDRRAFAMVFRGVSCRRDDAAFARYQANLKQQHESLGLVTT